MDRIAILTFGPSQCKGVLDGQTRPVLFEIADTVWVFRYQTGDGRQVRLASECMGYKVASWLGVPVPEFCLARTSEAFSKCGVRVPASLGSATRWIGGARYPDLEHKPLETFWEEDKYLKQTAAARIADTWMMNYDRRKPGNVAVRGNGEDIEVNFLDFDQAFLAKEPPRPHWIADNFTNEMLNDRELLSGFSGTGEVKSETVQRREHFDSSVTRLRSVNDEDVKQAVRDIPTEWGIDESDRCIWVSRLLARREIVMEILNEYGAL